MSLSDKQIELISAIKRGKQRRFVFQSVEAKPKLVSEITRDVNKVISNIKEEKEIRLRDVSRTLKWLEKQSLIKCLNPPDKPGAKGIMYILTNQGINISKKISKNA